MMPSATQDHQLLCDNPDSLVKPESSQMLDEKGHRDESVQLCDHKPIVASHYPLEANSMVCDNTQVYDSQLTSTNSQQVQDPISVDRDISPSAEHHLISLPQDIKDAQASNNDENPAVSAVQMSSDAAQFACSENFLPVGMRPRAKREFVPDERKDDTYWCKRLKNNDSARRSRDKRKALQSIREERLQELQMENIALRHEKAALRRHAGDEVFQFEASPSKDTLNISSLPSSLPETAQANSLHQSSVPVDPLLSELAHVVDRNTTASLDHGFGTDITDHIENNAYSKTNIRRSTAVRTESGDSQTSNCDSEIRKTTALDLTRKCNRPTPTWGSFSSDGGRITNSYSFQTSDSSSEADNTSIAQANVDHGLGTAITDHIENSAYSKTVRRSTVARTEAGDPQTSSCDSEKQNTTALDLTRKCNRPTPTWDSFSSDDESISSRYTFQTSDSSKEDNTSIAQANMEETDAVSTSPAN